MSTNNPNQPTIDLRTDQDLQFPNSFQDFEKAGKDLGLSGKTDLAPFVQELERQLGLVKTKFDNCLQSFEDKMQAEREKIEGLIASIEEKQEEIREKSEYLHAQLPYLRKVQTMTEISKEQRRKIQNATIDQELEFINDMRQGLAAKLKALHSLNINQTFVQSREDFVQNTQDFTEELMQTREQIKAFQLGFAVGKGIYDDIQAMNQTPPPPGTGPDAAAATVELAYVNGNGHRKS